MRFGEPLSSLRGVRAALSPVPWTDAELQVSGAADPRAEPEIESKAYHSLSYLNPFKYWLPFPLLRAKEAAPGDENTILSFIIDGDMVSLDGAGMLSVMTDPARINQITMTAAFDARSLAGLFDIEWINSYFGLPLTFTFADDVDRSGGVWPLPVRTTAFGFSAAPSFDIGNGPANFALFPAFSLRLAAPDTGDGASAYTWEYGKPGYIFSLGAGISSRTLAPWEIFGSGLGLTVYGRSAMTGGSPFTFRVEGLFQAAFEPFLPLRFRLYGIWDENRMNLAGSSTLYSDSAADGITPHEYSAAAYSLEWLAGGEAEFKLFSLEIQRNLSHTYYNRVFSTLAYRGGFYDYGGKEDAAAGTALWDNYRLTQSLIARLGLVFSSAVIPMLPLKFTFTVQGILKVSNLSDADSANDYGVGFYFGVSGF
jgi:hypothetical protein